VWVHVSVWSSILLLASNRTPFCRSSGCQTFGLHRLWSYQVLSTGRLIARLYGGKPWKCQTVVRAWQEHTVGIFIGNTQHNTLSCFLPVVRSWAFSHREYGQREPTVEPGHALRGFSHDLQSSVGLLPATENRPSVVSMRTGLRDGRLAVRFQAGKINLYLLQNVPTASGAQTSLLFIEYQRSFRRGVKRPWCEAHRWLPFFLPRLRMSRAIPLFPPNAFMSVPANRRSDFIRFGSHLSLTSCNPALGNFDKRDHKWVHFVYTITFRLLARQYVLTTLLRCRGRRVFGTVESWREWSFKRQCFIAFCGQ